MLNLFLSVVVYLLSLAGTMLKECKDVFAWTYASILGLDIISHGSNEHQEGTTPVKHAKARGKNQTRIQKLLDVGFISKPSTRLAS